MSENRENKIKWDIIPAEIKNDLFYNLIIELLKTDKSINNILEIGASSGDGSTEAFMIGKNKNVKLFSIEVCTERFNILKNRYKDDKLFYPYNISSININSFPRKGKIINFYNKNSEDCILWNDPEIGITWNIESPILSEKDLLGKKLSEFDSPF